MLSTKKSEEKAQFFSTFRGKLWVIKRKLDIEESGIPTPNCKIIEKLKIQF